MVDIQMMGDGAPLPHASPVHRGHCDVLMGRVGAYHPEVLSHLASDWVTCPQLDGMSLDPCRAQRLSQADPLAYGTQNISETELYF